ncbi:MULTISPECIES: methyltransferase [Halobacterium]|uniref:Methyltransferase domain-containing protein n=1 Tax=Halobacterium salinarum (strain ATCC 33171 / DSM 3754 / JCM 8978 / NBRC 102687 / NCIMB 764 / 91-R6) TaxID=2597657 RepID=A0A4D6GXR3_HALS9|nr:MULTISPECIES: class I SAM-dependent methyltransferase [Halobacterium]MDL0136849.1 class I SAM-dependent methyltransferase [Halobacterium salinarum]MDL0144829.1 class I SAM-dependent methyltransferase [Halobacterium salinarum]QCC45047.1 putative S-adenosylmethionine-dependent methyltransferase [Halobacterium salinarum]QRY23647.1 class I SAM-dependent methyltransferase [Halobacterium sp. GSL-19]TYO76159.1 Methyltransferase domain-containing protein [Halobacterium salinarum DSM 3754]
MPVDRGAVRDAAKYLRGVRPLDPAALREYVPGQPHEAVVRQVLREQAADLGIIERANGTFVVPPEEPVGPPFNGVSALPERYERVVEAELTAAYGPDWHRGDTGDSLRETIRRFKDDYYRRNPVEYDREVALGYAVYHLAGYYAAVQYVLAGLARDGLLGHDLRVLDLGAGVGGPAVGLFDFLPDEALVEYHAVEPSAAADVLDALLAETPRNVHTTIHRETAESFQPDGEYDLVLACSVLSELADAASVLRKYADAMAADGTALALAPADKHTSTHLRAVERAVEDDPFTVYGPTPRLWPDRRPTDSGWSFDERPAVEVPAVQSRLADASQDPGEFRHTDVRFSYSLLRRDDRRRHAVELSGDRLLALGDADDRVTDRADLLVAKLSRNLAGADANPVFRVSDGSQTTDCYAVLVRPTSLNGGIEAADYGDLVSIEDALVLWNDDEDAYNLVVDEETVVDAV